MPNKGLLIHVDGSTECRQIDSYHDIKAAVGGNFDWSAPGPVTFYCYEYALFERPVNIVATGLYKHTHQTTDPMCGDVLVVGPVVDENDSDVPQWFVEAVAELTANLGPEAIAEAAKPLSSKEQLDFHVKTLLAGQQAEEAFKQGRGVDFGGVVIGPPTPPPLQGTDGQHRTHNTTKRPRR
jgi:hypothetical protein